MSFTYSAIILAEPALVSYWKLDETSGTAAADSGAGGNPGVYSGTYTLAQTGIPGDLPGTAVLGWSGAMTVPDAANIRFAAPFSIELWAKLTGAGGWAITKYNSGAGFAGYGIQVDAATIQFWCGSSWYAPAVTVSSAVWHQVVATLSGTTASIYLDGALVASSTVTVNLAGTAPFVVGTTGFGGGLVGYIDNVSVYNAALSAARVLVHYNAGLGIVTGTLLHTPLDGLNFTSDLCGGIRG